MSKKKSKQNKNIITNDPSQPQKTVSKIDTSRDALPAASSTSVQPSNELLFGKKNFMFLLGGIGLIVIGYFLMAGGNMPSPDVWDENLIYSTRRTLIAPIFILAGLVMQVYAIFSKK